MTVAVGGALLRERAALLAIAHPDDECMFFGPTIACLLSRLRLHVLCLSTGDADGRGRERSAELYRSCAALGVARDRVALLDDPRLRDGMRTIWDPERVAQHLAAHLDRWDISAVVTFDERGVTRHPNHRALHAGARLLRARCSPPPRIYALYSTSLPRRLAAALDIPISLGAALLRRLLQLATWTPPPAFDTWTCCVCLVPWRAHVAMRCHASQCVWWRTLFMLVSRYAFANTLVRCDDARGGGCRGRARPAPAAAS